MKLQIKNVVVTIYYENEFNLDKLFEVAPKGSTYDPWSFSAVCWRLPEVSANIFASGKVVLVGIKDLSKIPVLIQTFENSLRERGIELSRKFWRLSNMVAMVDAEQVIDLIELTERLQHSTQVVYEPETFPAATIRKQFGTRVISFNVFSTGRIMIFGCRSMGELKLACNYIKEILGGE